MIYSKWRDIGRRLKRARIKKGLSIVDAAFGIATAEQWENWEAGQAEIPADLGHAAAKSLGVTVESLVGDGIGRRLQEAREAKGLTISQAVLAINKNRDESIVEHPSMLDFKQEATPDLWSKWESGDKELPLSEGFAACEVLGVDPYWLIGDVTPAA